MTKFWTVTDGNTTRYGTKNGAINEAESRIRAGKAESVFILESVYEVRLAKQPIEVIEIQS